MALTLVVERDRWREHLDRAASARPGLVPVVKGNGYGFGRPRLLAECARLGLREVAVGTAWELDGLAADQRAVVLTPCTAADAAALTAAAIPTVGERRDVTVLLDAGWSGPVVVKLRSSMRRYGVAPTELADLLTAVADAGQAVQALAIHFPLRTTSAQHTAELAAWLPRLPAACTVHVSHVDPADLSQLSMLAAGRRLRPRVGTGLWLGERRALHLVADVVAVHPVGTGEPAGYRQVPAPSDGHLVLVSAGTAHGVHPLDDGRSPFHFARTRLDLLEPPHMHTSMLHVPSGGACPEPGDHVDVQRPLTRVAPDRILDR